MLEHKIEKASDRVDTYQSVLMGLKNDISESSKLVFDLVEMKNKLERKIGGSESKKEVGEKDNLTIYDRLWSARGVGIRTPMGLLLCICEAMILQKKCLTG